ncbi:MAG: HNH endonuclease [Holosporaceae bacterium]|nr:HNH endonuclease [Holosporaceae bacterium]
MPLSIEITPATCVQVILIADRFRLHHKDGDRSNNSLNNLQPLTPREHAHIHKTQRRALLFENQLQFERR